MSARRKPRPSEALVWERPEPANRAAPSPLSRERIVRAAIALADEHGLGSVSLRKVGASLDAGPMRLYGYLSTKEELLALMLDAVYGEMAAPGPLEGDWKEALRTIAQRTRRSAHAHRWVIDLLGGRPPLGPHGLAYMEAALGALSGTPGFEHIDVAMQVIWTVNAYVIGAIRSEALERHAELESGLNETQWQHATSPYIQRMLATGQFPNLARVVKDANHPAPELMFAAGLNAVLDGLAARLLR